MRRFVCLGLMVAIAACGSGSTSSNGSSTSGGSVQLMNGFDPGPPPDPSKGFQIIAPIVHDIAAGTSVEYCTYTNVILKNDIWIKSTEGFETAGGHHVVIFYTTNPQPENTHVCTSDDMAEFKMGIPASAGEGVHTMTLPGDLAIHIPAGVQIVLNHHYLNASATDIPEAQAALNIYYADPNSKYVNAGSAVITNTSMTLPVGASTYSVDCTVNRDYALWQMTPHMHSWGTHITIDHTSATGTERMFDMDWSPDYAFDQSAVMKQVDPSTPVMFKAGDKIHIQCDYMNTTKAPLTFGDEMCLFFGETVDSDNIGNMMCDNGVWGAY